MMKRVIKHLNFYTVVNSILLFVVCKGIYTSLFMNSVNRTLWIDEAFLASSFSKRSFWGILLEGRFEYLQSAPLGWLWFVKILTKVFRNTPYVLRAGSIVGFVLTIVALIYIELIFYHSKFPFVSAAFVANTPILLRYSNIFKPYIMDAFVTLFAAVLYGLWKRKKIDSRLLSLVWMGLIWCSQIACFMIGGLCLSEFIFSLLNKNKEDILKSILLGISVAISFVVYYIIWVRRMTSVSEMQNYWSSYFFPFIPKSIADFNKGIGFLKQIIKQLDQAYIFIFSFSIGGIVYSVLKKDRILIGLYFGLLITLFASYLHFYPIYDRLWCFSFPVLALVSFRTLEGIANKKGIIECVIAFVMLIIVLENTGIKTYSKAVNVYWSNQELGSELNYLRSHMNSDDMVYVYSFSRPAFEYINGYDNFSFGDGVNNVIFGAANFDWRFQFDYQAEIQKILSYSKLWIVSSHTKNSEQQFTKLLQAMHENGYLQLVNYQYNTPLWYYCNSLDDVKNHFTMTLKNVITTDGWNEAVIHIKNDGKAYLNNPYDNIYLEDRYNGKIYPVDGLIAPGGEKDITVRFPTTEEPEYVLCSQFGKIAKDDSIIITKDMIEEYQKG